MLAHQNHRPWPLPTQPWVMTQVWHDLLFAHWPVPPATLIAHIPPGLQLDTYAHQAWVGVVPFRMSGIHLRGLPPIPGFDAFLELNVRTYVTCEHKPGVLFFSLDASNPVAVAVARRWFHLPYFYARMHMQDEEYISQRIHRGAPAADFLAHYRPTGEPFRAESGTLAHWLTERYCLYTADSHGQLYRGDIHHIPWPLQRAEARIYLNTMTLPHGIRLPDTPPLLHFARRLDVCIWSLESIRPLS